MAISQKTTDALKKKYATADALQSSVEFSKLTPEMQKTALWAYNKPIIRTMDVNDKVKSGELDVSQATIEPVKKPNTKPTTVDTPPATTPVETIKKEPEIKSTEVNPYQDDSDERISNIKNNLKIYTEDMPNLFANTDDYKKFFNYSRRSDTQKKLLDTYYNQYKYNTLFNGKTANSIWDMVINGTVSQWDIQTLNTTNPELYTQVQEYVQKNDEYNNANSAISGTKTKMQTIAEAIGVELPEDVDLSAKYTELHNTPEIQEASTKVNTLYSEIQEIDQQISDMESIVEKEYEWTGATKDKISLIAIDRQEALSRERTRKYIAYQAEAANYNTKVANADNAYNAYKDQVTAQNDKFKNSLDLLKSYSWLTETNDWAKTVVNPITWQIFQWNPKTSLYDIPIWWWTTTSTWDSSSTQNQQSWISNWNSYTDEQKNSIIDKMKQYEWWKEGSRTQRNNNPTAMTTDVAKQWWLILWVDYEKWDPFTTASWQTLYTAKLLWDAYEKTRKVIDKIWFYTQKWSPRWSYVDKLWIWGTSSKEFTNTQISAIQAYLKDPTEKNFYSYLSPNWLTKEDANLYKSWWVESLVNWYNPDDAWVYKKYLSWGASKSDYEQFWGKNELSKQAAAWYKNSIASRFDNVWFEVSDTFLDYYKTLSSSKQTEVDDVLWEVASIVSQTDKVLNYLEVNWVPSSTTALTGNWTKYLQELRKLQMSAKSENIFNLWVLNWPDLEVLNDILPASRRNVLVLDDDEVKESIISYRDYLIENFNAKNMTKWLAYSYKWSYPEWTYINKYNVKNKNNDIEKAKQVLLK